MNASEALQNQIMKIIDDQLVENEPPEVQKTLERLKYKGYEESEARKLIGQCVGVELFAMFNWDESFDQQRYVNNLLNLPDQPFDKLNKE